MFGMFAAHLLEVPAFDWGRPDTWVSVVDGRSSILFALLAGVSIALVSGGTRPVAGPALTGARRRIAVRAALLWLIGILLILTGVPVYVILPAYALLFLLALPLLPLRWPALLAIASALALVTPWLLPFLDALPVWSGPGGQELFLILGWAYPFPVWISFVVAGMALGRMDLRPASTAVLLLAAGTALAVLGGLADRSLSGVPDPYLAEVLTAGAHTGGLFEVIASGGFAVAVLGACLLVARTPLGVVLYPVRAAGSMPLTAYAGQIVAWAIVAAVTIGDVPDLDAFRSLHPFWPFTLATLVAATVWARTLGRGPLERLVALLVSRSAPVSVSGASVR